MENSNKIVKFDVESREKMLEGINVLANAVKVTMGPRGRNVVIETIGRHPIVTKDGVTVAKSINLRDRFENLGVQMIKEAASRTAEVAGDGTTTATVLSQAIFVEGLKSLAAGYQPSEIKKGIEYSVIKIIENLKDISIPITSDNEILQVATISANSEKEIGSLILSAINAVGRDGSIAVEDAKGFKSDLVVVEGLQINRGYISPYFITNQEKMTAELDNPAILLCNKKITSLREITAVLEQSLNQQKSILLIADDVDGDALQGLVVNKTKGTLQICALRAPGFGESRLSLLDDMSIMTGCKVYSDASNDRLCDIKIEDLGECRKVSVSRNHSTFIGCNGNTKKIEERISLLKDMLSDPSLDEKDIGFIRSRISMLSGGIAILRIGGATESELTERKDRVDDALNATMAAIEEGIVPGGGVALVRSSRDIEIPNNATDGFKMGISVVKNACVMPFKQIIKNSGGVADVILEKALSLADDQGYDASIEEFGDMFEMGIIDPVKVVRTALENASSAAVMLLTVGCALVEDDIDKSNNS